MIISKGKITQEFKLDPETAEKLKECKGKINIQLINYGNIVANNQIVNHCALAIEHWYQERMPIGDVLESVEMSFIKRAALDCGNRQAAISDRIGISPSTLKRRLRKYKQLRLDT